MVRRVELFDEIINFGKVDVRKIDKASARQIGYDWYEMLEEFYAVPENEKAFQEWLKNGKK